VLEVAEAAEVILGLEALEAQVVVVLVGVLGQLLEPMAQ
jgi:hypothetical protein